MSPRSRRRDSLRADLTAGAVLGLESVPDGLATGLLAGVNPLAGVYGYMVGTVAGALATSSAFMAVQGTGAMAIIVADVSAVHNGTDPDRALFTLSILTGVVMLGAGFLRLGAVLRFVSNAVMVGFINAVGVNIILGQLSNLTGYSSDRGSRVTRALDTLLHPGQLDGQSVAIGLATIVLIIVLERTRLGALGLVAAVVVTSAAAKGFDWPVATVGDLDAALGALPRPQLPDLGVVPSLVVPALSLALVGLVQGAGISANFPNADGSYPDASRDFVGQGVANIASGALEGMPVGGSVSGTSLNKAAGARTRASLVFTGVVMAVIIVAFADLIGSVAMPALAGLLMLVGYRTITPADLASVWRTGRVQQVVMVTTFVLTIVVKLQYAVLAGVALSLGLYVVRQSNRVTIKRQVLRRRRAVHRDRHRHRSSLPTKSWYSSRTAACSSPRLRSSMPRSLPRQQNHAARWSSCVCVNGATSARPSSISYGATPRVSRASARSSSSSRSTSSLLTSCASPASSTSSAPKTCTARSERVGAATERAYRDAVTWVAARDTEDPHEH